MKLKIRSFRIAQIKQHLLQINNLLKDPNMTIENMQDLNKYFELMAARTKAALAQACEKIEKEEESNGTTKS